MTPTTKKQIVTALEKYLAQHTMSANVFVEKSNVNEAYISGMRNGTYLVGKTEIAPKWFEMVADQIGFELKKSYWHTVPTPQFSNQLSVLEDAREFGYTNVIIGETGSGKTFTAETFVKAYPQHSFMIKVGSSDNLSDLIDKILDQAKIPTAKTKSKNINGIVNFMKKLKFEGHKPTLVLDECEYMKIPTLCMMKELYDGLIGHCAIVMIGTDEFLDNLNKLTKRKKAGIRQFYRRVKFSIRSLPSINRNFDGFLDQVQDKALVRFLRANCDNYGELHDAMVPAMREADRTGQPLTENFVRKVLNMPEINR